MATAATAVTAATASSTAAAGAWRTVSLRLVRESNSRIGDIRIGINAGNNGFDTGFLLAGVEHGNKIVNQKCQYDRE